MHFLLFVPLSDYNIIIFHFWLVTGSFSHSKRWVVKCVHKCSNDWRTQWKGDRAMGDGNRQRQRFCSFRCCCVRVCCVCTQRCTTIYSLHCLKVSKSNEIVSFRFAFFLSINLICVFAFRRVFGFVETARHTRSESNEICRWNGAKVVEKCTTQVSQLVVN